MCQVFNCTMMRKRPVVPPTSSSAESTIRTPGRLFASSSCRSNVASRDGYSGQHRVEHRPDAELFGASAAQFHFGDAAFDHLDAHPSIGDVLRRHDGAGKMKAGRAIAIADGLRDRREVCLRDYLAEIGPIDCCQFWRGNAIAPEIEIARSTNSGLFSAVTSGRASVGVRGGGATARSGPDCRSSKYFSVCRGSKPGWFACCAVSRPQRCSRQQDASDDGKRR